MLYGEHSGAIGPPHGGWDDGRVAALHLVSLEQVDLKVIWKFFNLCNGVMAELLIVIHEEGIEVYLVQILS